MSEANKDAISSHLNPDEYGCTIEDRYLGQVNGPGQSGWSLIKLKCSFIFN